MLSAPLDSVRLKSLIDAPELGFVEVFSEVDSTNSYLLAQPIHRHVARLCLAEAQSAGRGRHGNTWVSAPNQNVMLSLSWGFNGWPQNLSALSLAVGLAVATVLIEDFEVNAKIKWPNDILVDDAKLAGILIDIAGHQDSDCQLVIGLGLNVCQPDWGDDLPYPWVDLASLGIDVDRNQLVAKIVRALLLVLEAFERHGFGPMIEAWNTLSAFHQRRVAVIGGEHELQGVFLGVDSDGALLLLDDNGQHQRVSDSKCHLRLVTDHAASD